VTFRRDDQNAAKPTFYDSIQLIQSHLYATTGFIDCAMACKGDYIVSGDRHLLELKEYAGIRILQASEFLSIISKGIEK
jgi:hypothetical protein